jgi:hypothetical protein
VLRKGRMSQLSARLPIDLVCERFTSYQFWRAFRLPIDFGHFDVSFVRNIQPELIGSWFLGSQT